MAAMSVSNLTCCIHQSPSPAYCTQSRRLRLRASGPASHSSIFRADRGAHGEWSTWSMRRALVCERVARMRDTVRRVRAPAACVRACARPRTEPGEQRPPQPHTARTRPACMYSKAKGYFFTVTMIRRIALARLRPCCVRRSETCCIFHDAASGGGMSWPTRSRSLSASFSTRRRTD